MDTYRGGPVLGTEEETVDVVDLVVLEAIEAELADVERALVRMDDGTYGTCEECGRPFGDEELEDTPAMRLCPEHASVDEPVVDPINEPVADPFA